MLNDMSRELLDAVSIEPMHQMVHDEVIVVAVIVRLGPGHGC
jgi:hypothetical protein